MIKKKGDLPPKERVIVAPEDGWEAQTYYVVDVSVGKGNPIHRAILYTGFMPENCHHPFDVLRGGYCCLLSATSEYDFVHRVHYLRVVGHAIPGLGQFEELLS